MPTLAEKEAKAKLRAKALDDKATEDARKAKVAAANARAAARASRKKRIEMIGETIVLAHEAGSLTPQDMATIGGILTARKETPADWALLAEYMPPPAAVRPAAIAEPDELAKAAAE